MLEGRKAKARGRPCLLERNSTKAPTICGLILQDEPEAQAMSLDVPKAGLFLELHLKQKLLVDRFESDHCLCACVCVQVCGSQRSNIRYHFWGAIRLVY